MVMPTASTCPTSRNRSGAREFLRDGIEYWKWRAINAGKPFSIAMALWAVIASALTAGYAADLVLTGHPILSAIFAANAFMVSLFATAALKAVSFFDDAFLFWSEMDEAGAFDDV